MESLFRVFSGRDYYQHNIFYIVDPVPNMWLEICTQYTVHKFYFISWGLVICKLSDHSVSVGVCIHQSSWPLVSHVQRRSIALLFEGAWFSDSLCCSHWNVTPCFRFQWDVRSSTNSIACNFSQGMVTYPDVIQNELLMIVCIPFLLSGSVSFFLPQKEIYQISLILLK